MGLVVFRTIVNPAALKHAPEIAGEWLPRILAAKYDSSARCAAMKAGVTIGMAMTDKHELKRAVCEAIDRHSNEIIELGETILHHPRLASTRSRPQRSLPSACVPSVLSRRPASP